jgi:hypothetical protein
MGVAIVVFSALGLFFFAISFSEMCGNRIVYSSVSPDNELQVIIFNRDCGATTGFSTQVSILSSYEKLNDEAGNVFIADDGYEDMEMDEFGLIKIEAKWINSKSLIITYDSLAQVFKKELMINGVAISYQYY